MVGARPNFVKMAPVIEAVRAHEEVRQLVVHTGQHYDERMSEEMMVDLRLPRPDVFLGIGSGTHGEQIGRALIAIERLLLDERPDLVVVGGDVNSTLATALAAAKADVPLAHVEAGLRSGDWTMPEEVNRVVTDRLSRLLFTHSPEAPANLAADGIDPARIRPVGNTMIDSLRRFEHDARARRAWERFRLDPWSYVLVTLHRPSNVDDDVQLARIVAALGGLARRAPVLFPVHPRTRSQLAARGLLAELEDAGVTCTEPVAYLDFLSLETHAGAVLTDSGGIQEETTALGVPCYTLRPNTERPVTTTLGTNTLLGDDPAAIEQVQPLGREPVPVSIPQWDGLAGGRVADALLESLTDDASVARADVSRA